MNNTQHKEKRMKFIKENTIIGYKHGYKKC